MIGRLLRVRSVHPERSLCRDTIGLLLKGTELIEEHDNGFKMAFFLIFLLPGESSKHYLQRL